MAGIGQLSAAQQAAAGNSAAQPAAQYGTVVMRYCLGCHNDKLKTAEFSLSNIPLDNIGANAPLWEKAVTKLRAGSMPPAGVPRPDKATYDGLAEYLETELDRAAAANPNPGRPLIHRLNRAEYANVVRDLLGIEVDAASLLPEDDASYGFDNIGDVLTVSPTLFERYMSAAGKISRLAVGDPTERPSSDVYTVSERMVQNDRLSEDLPFGTRGGIAFRHYFPVDGEYVIRVRLQRDRVHDIIGLSDPHQLDVRLDDTELQQFTVGGNKEKSKKSSVHDQETYSRTADAGLEIRFAAKAGPRLVGVAFLNRFAEPEGVLRRRVGLQQYTTDEDIPGVESVTVTGPYDSKGSGDTPSREKIFVCHPTAKESQTAETACAKKILGTLARRAYRRPATDREVQTLLNFYQEGRDKRGFDAGIELAVRRILVSPDFLFRIERDPAGVSPGSVYRISDLELASRLSFFLWSSIPDDQLLDLAERGKLKDPAVLEQQVRRMFADPRSEALVTNFAGQWLYLRNLEKVVPNPETFPDFDENLRQSLERETQLFLESQLREDHSVLDLLDANYTFLNQRLSRHYGIPNIYGNHFRRVTFTDGEPRRGLLGQGSILTVTSYATRTSPTLRGKWLLENILGAPPPAPPNNVPSLKDRGEDGQVLSARQQMEQHRKSPACAGCHSLMDPLGFALENYDAIGRWRTTSGPANTPIDASGILPDGTKFSGPVELTKILLDHRDKFVSTVADKLLTYALGRGVEYYDAPAVRKIVRQAAAGDYRWSSLILATVNSLPFQMRRSAAP